MRRALIVPILLAAGLAGCFTPPDDVGPAATDDDTPLPPTARPRVPEGSPPARPTQGAPDAAPEGASPAPPPRMRDPWEGRTEVVLFEGDVDAGPCLVSPDPAATATIMTGCTASATPTAPMRVFEGTRTVRLEADPSRATSLGDLHSYAATPGAGAVVGTRGAGTTWTFDATALDWDAEDARSAWVFAVYAAAPGTLRGPVFLRILAERDPTFEPALLVDAWSASGGGALTLANASVSIHEPNTLDTTLGSKPTPPMSLGGAIPADATHVTVALAWPAFASCGPPLACRFMLRLHSGAKVRDHWLDRTGDGWGVVVLDIPDDAAPDGAYVTESRAMVEIHVTRCNDDLICVRTHPEQTIDVEIQLLVQAWRSEPDIVAIRAQLG